MGCAQLLHQPQRIPVEPTLLNPAVADTVDADGGHCDEFAGRGEAGKLALLLAADRDTGHNLVVFRHLVFNRELEFGKGAVQVSHKCLEPLASRRFTWQWIVVDIVSGDNLVGDMQIALVIDLLKTALENCFVGCKHERFAFRMTHY